MKVLHNCDVCGSPFMSDSRNLARGWGRCCSKKCASKRREMVKKAGYDGAKILLPLPGENISHVVSDGGDHEFITWNSLKASELRIGNIVCHEGKIKRISAIGATDNLHDYEFVVFKDEFEYWNWLDQCQPVPLTEEILRDWCGFKKALRVEGLTKYGIDLVAAGDGYYDNRTGRKITTLHQLQNFVFAVSGNELEVKIPTT